MTSGSVPRRPPRGLAPRGPGYDGEGGGFGRDAATLPIPYPARASACWRWRPLAHEGKAAHLPVEDPHLSVLGETRSP